MKLTTFTNSKSIKLKLAGMMKLKTLKVDAKSNDGT